MASKDGCQMDDMYLLAPRINDCLLLSLLCAPLKRKEKEASSVSVRCI